MVEGAREQPCRAPTLPAGLHAATAGAAWFRDTVGEAGCAVWRIADGRDRYLKHGTGEHAGDVLDEAVRLRWLAGRVAAPVVRQVLVDGDAAWLLTDAVPGETAWMAMTRDPAGRGAVVDALADCMRALHALPIDDCPFEAGQALRLAHARRRLAAGLIDEEDFGEAHAGWPAARLFQAMDALLPFGPDRVVTHGDFSLDNLLVRDGRVTGMIDVGRLGLADRYQDIAILWDCLGEFDDPTLRPRFLARYGLAAIDARRLDFHLLLDECF